MERLLGGGAGRSWGGVVNAGSGAGAEEGPIDAYLDELFVAARDGDPAAARRLLAETEAHLRECAARLRGQGLDPEDAEREAVRRFGPVGTVTPVLRPALRDVARLPLRAFVRPLVGLAAVGAIAVGVSGAISELFGRIWGAGFVAGDLPGVAYTAAQVRGPSGTLCWPRLCPGRRRAPLGRGGRISRGFWCAGRCPTARMAAPAP